MKTQVLTEEGLIQYNELIKNYINSQSNSSSVNEVISDEEPEQDIGGFWLEEY